MLLLDLIAEAAQLSVMDLSVVLHLFLQGSLWIKLLVLGRWPVMGRTPGAASTHLHLHSVLQSAHVLFLLVHHDHLVHLACRHTHV